MGYTTSITLGLSSLSARWVDLMRISVVQVIKARHRAWRIVGPLSFTWYFCLNSYALSKPIVGAGGVSGGQYEGPRQPAFFSACPHLPLPSSLWKDWCSGGPGIMKLLPSSGPFHMFLPQGGAVFPVFTSVPPVSSLHKHRVFPPCSTYLGCHFTFLCVCMILWLMSVSPIRL